jgi:DNA invertase Pin-like site-specific DNA recombinase
MAAIMRLVKEKGWLITREFKDERPGGVSTRNRKAFELMIHLARQKPRQADMLIVWEFSRFARNQVDSQFYRAELRRNGWKLLSMKDDIPKSPISPIFEALIDWKNEQLIIDLRANTKRGLRYIAEQGCVPVGPVAIGYTYQGKQIGVTREGVLRMGRKPEPDPEVAPLVVTAFEMKASVRRMR